MARCLPQLPTVWYSFSLLFFIGLVYWCNNLRENWAHKQQIHLLMTLLCGVHAILPNLLLSCHAVQCRGRGNLERRVIVDTRAGLKVLTMLVDGLKLADMKATGTTSAWEWIWFILYGLKGALLFIVSPFPLVPYISTTAISPRFVMVSWR